MQQNVSLKPYNTFGLDATARYFVEVASLSSLQEVLQSPDFQSCERLILGGGSNLLLTQDFAGLVIKINLQGITIERENEELVWVKAGAGVVWHDFVLFCIENKLGGVENLSLIPGTVGAAPMQNIGAYGVEIKDTFESLEAWHIGSSQLHTFTHADCHFGYRESVFKHEAKGQYIITSVTFKLNKKPTFNVSYGDIQKTLVEMGVTQPSLKAISDAVIHIRQSKLPNPAEIGNAGSFFKNPEIPLAHYQVLHAQYPTMPSYKVADPTLIKVPAGWLIEQCGWKGFREGNIGVHARQALVLVNYGGGNGLEIKHLSEKIQASVFEKFGIRLSAEVNFV
jgi:UDP-N-acetylmuramate dehydrogenase